MNETLRQIVKSLEEKGYRFSFDDNASDDEVEETLDIVFSDCSGDFEDTRDDCGHIVTFEPARRPRQDVRGRRR
jgi:hypothetical protein